MSRPRQTLADAPSDGDRLALIRRRIGELGEWFHNFDLAGVQTAPQHALGNYPAVKWQRFAHAIPADLSGWSVLDIGCNAGFYTQEMKRRGAERVLGIDTDARYLAQARFAAEVAGVDVEFRQMSIYQVPSLHERFDLVLFMGVFYHLRYPFLALDILHAHVVDRLLAFQSMLRGPSEVRAPEPDYEFTDSTPFDEGIYPQMYFVEQCYAGDPTNWWIPTRAAVEAMLRSTGFEITDHPEDEVFVCRRLEPAPRFRPTREELPWSKP
jgi:tRNA (mo5U34)-methyltransferase